MEGNVGGEGGLTPLSLRPRRSPGEAIPGWVRTLQGIASSLTLLAMTAPVLSRRVEVARAEAARTDLLLGHRVTEIGERSPHRFDR